MLDMCEVLRSWTRTTKQTAGYRCGAQKKAGPVTAWSESLADVRTGGSHKSSGGGKGERAPAKVGQQLTITRAGVLMRSVTGEDYSHSQED